MHRDNYLVFRVKTHASNKESRYVFIKYSTKWMSYLELFTVTQMH